MNNAEYKNNKCNIGKFYIFMNSTKQGKNKLDSSNNANPKVNTLHDDTMKSKIEKKKGNSMQGRCENL
jgi:hypothetical protein